MAAKAPTAPATTRRRPALSERQKEILAFIRQRVASMGYPPTYREIGKQFDLKSTNGVSDHLKQLKRKGYLTFEDAKSRTLKLLDSPKLGRTPVALHGDLPNTQEGVIRLPLLGRVAAGEPILALEEARDDDAIVVDTRLLRGHGQAFALKVVGDSMIEAGIRPGDTVFVRARDYADAGDIAVVLIGQEATLKQYFPEKNRLRLQPANAKLAPIYISASEAADVRVLGVVVGVFRGL